MAQNAATTLVVVHTISFADTNLDVNNALQIIQDVVLNVVPVSYPVDPHAHCHMQSMMECYNVSGELEDDDELQNINISDAEGSRDVTAPYLPTDPINQPLKILKVNTGMKENQKFASVGDY